MYMGARTFCKGEQTHKITHLNGIKAPPPPLGEKDLHEEKRPPHRKKGRQMETKKLFWFTRVGERILLPTLQAPIYMYSAKHSPCWDLFDWGHSKVCHVFQSKWNLRFGKNTLKQFLGFSYKKYLRNRLFLWWKNLVTLKTDAKSRFEHLGSLYALLVHNLTL